jgi:hypothetical protein
VQATNLAFVSSDDFKAEAHGFLKESRTIGEAMKRFGLCHLPLLLAPLPSRKRELFLNRFVRYSEPWPEWVLRIAVEVLHVHVPTIPKRTIKDALRCIHFFLLEWQVHDETQSLPNLDAASAFDLAHFGAFYGHLFAALENARREIDQALASGTISAEKHAVFVKHISLNVFQVAIEPQLASMLKSEPGGWLEWMTALTKAKASTFDKSGTRKETTLTRIYAAILKNWPEIEALAGPTALCAYLSPVLGGRKVDPEKQMDRVKKICQRMGITFKPFVKGQTHPPGLSLPDNV